MSLFNLLGGASLPLIGLSLILSIALAVHVVRTGRELFWLWIILIFQPIGGLVYFLAILLPELMRGSGARRNSCKCSSPRSINQPGGAISTSA